MRSHRDVGASVVLHALRGERANAVEEPIARRAIGPGFEADERTIDQPTDDIDGGFEAERSAPQNVLDRVERGAVVEAREAHNPR